MQLVNVVHGNFLNSSTKSVIVGANRSRRAVVRYVDGVSSSIAIMMDATLSLDTSVARSRDGWS